MSIVQVVCEVSEAESNGVIWYHELYMETGKAATFIRKSHFVYVRTTPSLSTYWYSNSSLNDFCTNYIKSKPDYHSNAVVHAIFYSSKGYMNREVIKQQSDEKVAKSKCLWVLRCCLPTKSMNGGTTLLQELYFCRKLSNMYPDYIVTPDTVLYTFISEEEEKSMMKSNNINNIKGIGY